jgi:hypothetical protein
MHEKNDMEHTTMIIDVHRHLVAKDTVQGDYIRGAQKSFATDAPYPNLMCPLKEWVQAFKNRETDIHFTDEEINLILGEAARKVLKL